MTYSSRPESFELNAENYPFSQQLACRYSDMDPLAHVNNVAIANLFEEARVYFGMHCRNTSFLEMLQQQARVVTASALINYIGEVSYPGPVTVYVGVLGIGNSSYTLGCLMTQNGTNVAHCRIVVVRSEAGVATALPETLRDALSQHRIKQK